MDEIIDLVSFIGRKVTFRKSMYPLEKVHLQALIQGGTKSGFKKEPLRSKPLFNASPLCEKAPLVTLCENILYRRRTFFRYTMCSDNFKIKSFELFYSREFFFFVIFLSFDILECITIILLLFITI